MHKFLLGFISLMLHCATAPAQTDSACGEAVSDNVFITEDSLKLNLLELNIEQSRMQLAQSDFLHRLLPQIHISASFGINSLVFIDPSNTVPYLLPKDAYRLTLSLSINDILDFAKHSRAQLDLAKLQLEYQQASEQHIAAKAKLCRTVNALNDIAALMGEELKMKQDLLKFIDLRFQQGKIQYDALVRARLDVLDVQRNINRLNQQIIEIKTLIR